MAYFQQQQKFGAYLQFLKTSNDPVSKVFESKSKSFEIKSFQACMQLQPSVRNQNLKKLKSINPSVHWLCHAFSSILLLR